MKRILLSLLLAPALVMGQEPDGYYKNCEGAGGKDLLMRLYETVGPHTKVTYDGLWNVYKDSDVRPNGGLGYVFHKRVAFVDKVRQL